MSGCIRHLTVTAVAVALGLGGTTATVSAAPASCWDNAMSQMQMNMCADADFQRADQSLNQVYRQMRTVAGNVGGNAGGHTGEAGGASATTPNYLQDAQRAWLSYRDKECLSRTNGGPHAPGAGSIAPMEYVMCLTTLTNARVADLQKQRACSQPDTQSKNDPSDGSTGADCTH